MTDDELLEIAREAVAAAAPLLAERFGSASVLTTKSSLTDVVSAADYAAEHAIRAVLEARLPDDAVVGEEGTDVVGTTGRRWIVDPLDGTVNYLYGIPQWCVSVACEGHVGVICDPLRDEWFTATAEGPARLNERPLERLAGGTLGTALVATGFGYDAGRRARQAEVLAKVLPRARDIRRGGAAAIDLAWCAAGRIDAYYERGINPWDIAAGALICERAGLHVEHLPPVDGLPEGLLVAPKSYADELRALVT